MSDIKKQIEQEIDNPELRKAMLKALAATEQDRFTQDVENTLEELSVKAEKLFNVKIMPNVLYSRKATRSVHAVYKQKPVMKINTKAHHIRPEFVLKRALPSEFSKLVAIAIEKTTLETISINFIKKIRRLLTGSEKEVNTSMPVTYKQYLYTCRCGKQRWLRSEVHHRIKRKEALNPAIYHCNECNNDFWELNKEREITPEVIIKESPRGLIAITNGPKELIARGGINIKDFTQEVSAKGFKKETILHVV